MKLDSIALAEALVTSETFATEVVEQDEDEDEDEVDREYDLNPPPAIER